MRNFYVMPREITQGSIINNCLADCYPEAHVDGIIITPRCDLAHDAKVNFIHYLPIISFKEWLLNDGKEYLFAKWFEKKKNNFEKQCKLFRIPSSIPNKDNYEKMAKAIITDKNSYSSFMDSVNAYFDANIESPTFLSHLKNKKVKELVIDNLAKDALPAYYLAEDWEKNGHSFKIILLRELKRISFKTAMFLSKGMKVDQVDFCVDDLQEAKGEYYIQAQVASPFIEHIMQRFSYNFCRVGVKDRDKSRVVEILTKVIDNTYDI